MSERLVVGQRVRVVGAPRSVVQGKAGEVVGVVPMETGWVCVSVAIDGEDDDDPWMFDAEMLAPLPVPDDAQERRPV